jgi:serine protease Do
MPSDAQKIKPLYEFLLQENNKPSGLVLSCVKNNIVLSRLIYDLDMTRESGVEEFKNLFEKADHYDDYLKETFGCLARLEE